MSLKHRCAQQFLNQLSSIGLPYNWRRMSTKSLIEPYRKHILAVYSHTRYVNACVLDISRGQGLDTLATSLHTERLNTYYDSSNRHI